jgi:hypothetical protein
MRFNTSYLRCRVRYNRFKTRYRGFSVRDVRCIFRRREAIDLIWADPVILPFAKLAWRSRHVASVCIHLASRSGQPERGCMNVEYRCRQRKSSCAFLIQSSKTPIRSLISSLQSSRPALLSSRFPIQGISRWNIGGATTCASVGTSSFATSTAISLDRDRDPVKERTTSARLSAWSSPALHQCSVTADAPLDQRIADRPSSR